MKISASPVLSHYLRHRRHSLFTLSLVCVTILILLILFVKIIDLQNSSCALSDSEALIEDVCTLYKKKEVVGSLCNALCEEKTLRPTKCLAMEAGKQVILGQCKDACRLDTDVTVVLKMVSMTDFTGSVANFMSNVKDKFTNLYGLYSGSDTMENHEYKIEAESLGHMIMMRLKEEDDFEMVNDEDVIQKMWGWSDYKRLLADADTSLPFAHSLWSVILQNEYRMSKIFQDRRLFPEIFGTCGPLYTAEYTPSEKFMEKLLPLARMDAPPWEFRANLAIHILNLLQRMEESEYPLNMCDIKAGHFGQGVNEELRFLDVDTIFPDRALMTAFSSTNCADHSNCAFFDCEGWCDGQIGRCLPMRTNNNLQVVCNKVFRGSSFSIQGGLLSNPPSSVASELTSQLDSCAVDVTKQDGSVDVRKPSNMVLVSLHKLLLKSLVT